jgi:hypothetical protein
MNTKMWGPPAWKFTHTITFNYPETINWEDEQQVILSNKIKTMFTEFQNTLPCKYCRESFRKFLKQLPIEPFLGSRRALTYWFYCIHNKVNQKLRGQEWELFVNKLKELLNSREGPSTTKKYNLSQLFDANVQNEIDRLKRDVLFTKPDPSYDEVCEFYEMHRAGKCKGSKNKIKSCRL